MGKRAGSGHSSWVLKRRMSGLLAVPLMGGECAEIPRISLADCVPNLGLDNSDDLIGIYPFNQTETCSRPGEKLTPGRHFI